MPITSPSDIPEYQLRDHLNNGGLLGAFTDIYGDAQAAPVVQVGLYDEKDATGGERILLIRSANSGGPSDEFVQYQAMLISMSGIQSYEDWLIVKARLSQIHQWLLDNHNHECILNLDDLSDVTGPYFTESDRPVAEINFRLVLERP